MNCLNSANRTRCHHLCLSPTLIRREWLFGLIHFWCVLIVRKTLLMVFTSSVNTQQLKTRSISTTNLRVKSMAASPKTCGKTGTTKPQPTPLTNVSINTLRATSSSVIPIAPPLANSIKLKTNARNISSKSKTKILLSRTSTPIS